MDKSTFEYLKPTDDQMTTMGQARELFSELAKDLDLIIPEGPDKTYLMRKLREVAMWANIAITRHPDGTPRS
jgi:hypothetical protein